MTLQTLATAGAKWLWEKYGKDLLNETKGKLKEAWLGYHEWKEAEAKYRARLKELYSTTRLLGNPKPIIIEDIYTDAYVLDKPNAFRRYNLPELQAIPLERESLELSHRRRSALRLVTTEKRLYILGKPGAGKTTFLKYLVMQACAGKIPKTPFFIPLKEWADSGMELMPFLIRQFEICEFPDAGMFIERLLRKGDTLVLFDGLDEVNQEGKQRSKMIRVLTEFAKEFRRAQICVSCRIAATDYSFTDFTYLEIADFDEKQMRLFANKWYRENRITRERFLEEFARPENKGLRELARTPLLLTLLCLAFDETMTFPLRRVDLYKDALDALLKKWDSSRDIRRDQIYRQLSPVRKEQLLAQLAAENFKDKAYFLSQERLARQIELYLQKLPTEDIGVLEPPDGEAILKAIELQHGILIERAHTIYSFSHLTFQEYFTARYIIENASTGTIERLIASHLTDDRWREVFLLTASLLPETSRFFDLLLAEIETIVQRSRSCSALLIWVDERAKQTQHPTVKTRVIFIFLALIIARALSNADGTGIRARAFEIARMLAPNLAPSMRYYETGAFASDAMVYAKRELGVELEKELSEPKWYITGDQVEHLAQYINSKSITEYLTATQLILDCLRLAAVSDRTSIEERLFLPVKAPSRIRALPRKGRISKRLRKQKWAG